MGGGGHGQSWYDTKLPYGGFEPPMPRRAHKTAALVIGTTMWFWVFWRLKHDWRHLFVRHTNFSFFGHLKFNFYFSHFQTSHRPYEIHHEAHGEEHH